MAAKPTAADIASLTNWTADAAGKSIHRELRFKDFSEAWGFMNRVAPTLNLFSLGFSVVTLFGLFMLAQMLRFVPEHYVRMTGQVLEMLQRQMRGLPHG